MEGKTVEIVARCEILNQKKEALNEELKKLISRDPKKVSPEEWEALTAWIEKLISSHKQLLKEIEQARGGK